MVKLGRIMGAFADKSQDKPYSMSVPFLPGTTMIGQGATVPASFVPEAGVIISR